jgi:tetratricopeptide (TPR) repeat protein
MTFARSSSRLAGPVVRFVLLVGAVHVNLPAAAEDDATRRFFDGLRSRKLFSLAENYSLRRLATPEKLSTEQRVDFTLELSRTLVEHAQHSTGDEQAELWRKAHEVLADLISAVPNNPRRMLIEAESAFVLASQGEWLRWQVELVPEDRSTREQSLTTLGRALTKLRELDRDLAEVFRKAPATSSSKDEPRPHELRWLWQDVRFRLASSLLDHAQLLPADSPDRAAILIETKTLLKTLAGSPDDDELTWNSRVLLAQCHRLLGDHEQALAVLDTLQQREPPPAVIDRLIAERTRVLLALKRTDDAQQSLTTHLRTRQPLPGELAYLQSQMWSARFEAAGRGRADAEAAIWRQRLEQLVEQVERDVGGYWAARCRLVMQQAQDAQTYGPKVAAIVRVAQAAFHDKRPTDAITKYGEAAALANRESKPDVAFDLAFTRASVQLQIKNWTDAATSFKELADRFENNPRAAEAHLLQSFALGKLFEEKPTQTRRLAYSAALDEHRRRFANHATAAEAAWMQAQFEEQRGQWTAAIELYRLVSREHARGPAALIAIGRCHERILHRLRELSQPTADWESAALTELRQVLAPDAKWPKRLDDSQAEVAVRLAAILLTRQPPEFVEADRWLELAMTSDGDEVELPTTSSRRASALPLRIVSLAGQGRATQARDLLTSLTTTNPKDLLRIVEGLFAVPKDLRSATKRDLAELFLQAAENLARHREQLTPPEQRRLDLCFVQAYLDTGQFRKAIERHDALATQAARDPALLQRLAEVVSACDRPECREKAQSTWRKLEGVLTAGSAEWFHARYQVASIAVELGRLDECRKLIGVTKLLYPELGGEEMRRKLLELERRCAP